MPKIKYIHSTSVFVSNQDAALDFYVSKLGFEKMTDMPMGPEARWVTVAPVGAQTHLALLPMAWYEGEGEPSRNSGIALVTDDIDSLYETWTGLGIKFKAPVEVMPWGDKAVWFYDLDGNAIFLVENQ
jgi:catechol 2,3-dioxygenase-like lactoylglutathione lyase family enzyme